MSSSPYAADCWALFFSLYISGFRTWRPQIILYSSIVVSISITKLIFYGLMGVKSSSHNYGMKDSTALLWCPFS